MESRVRDNEGRDIKIPIFMFHAVDSSEHPSELTKPGDILYVLDEGEFEGYLRTLNASGYVSILLEELVAAQRLELPLSRNTVVLTFDDGHVSNYTKALPLLRKYRFRAEFFISTGLMGTRHHMNQGQIRDLLLEGMGVGSHGVSHRYLTDLSPDNAKEELISSKKRLEKIIGDTVIAFSPPGGRISDSIRSMASHAGYEIICDSSPHANTRNTPPLALGRFAVSRGMGLPDFMRLAKGQIGWKDRGWSGLKTVAKKALGTARYEAVRERTIRMVRGPEGLRSKDP